MYIKTCEACGKKFETRSKWKRACCEICVTELKKRSHRKNKNAKSSKDQICINCQRATGKNIDGIVCPWAHNLSVVPGWTAKKILLKEDYTPYESYDIISCPLFLHDAQKKTKNEEFYGWEDLKDALLKYQEV